MTTQNPNDVGWVSEPVTRGTSSLLYTCISTTIICTWSALHLNVPKEGLSAGRVLVYKIIWFVAAIIAPEALVGMAAIEWLEARKLSKIMAEIFMGERKWPHAFSHLILMHGVKLHISTASDSAEVILSVDDIIYSAEQGWIRCEELSVAAVEDKSKTSAFNKAVTSIQIFWFFSQLLGRLNSSIVISPLEWFTLAYVICAFFMYGFWWHKPFDVQTPLLIYTDPSLSAEQTLELKHSFKEFKDLDDFFNMVDGNWGRESTMGTRHDREWIGQVSNNRLTQIAIAISTVLFGSCHLFGWNYPFSTTFETYIWRSASISCVGIPLVILFWYMLEDFALTLSIKLPPYILWLLGIMYIVVRLFLLFEVFFALRSAPPEIYKAVPWAQYLPHI